MRIRATCDNCNREFLFFQLYNADPRDADRCPHCSTHLGVLGGRHLALAADRAAAALVRALDDLAARRPEFTVDRESVLSRIEAAVEPLTDVATDDRQPQVRRLGRRAA